MGMKTAVSIPDEVFTEAEELRRQLEKSRSELYSNALREYLARHGSDSVTEALDEIWNESPADTALAKSAAKHTLRRTEW
jgi:metal-responsive CopG/Arc/MetJ family transcriptional regulator